MNVEKEEPPGYIAGWDERHRVLEAINTKVRQSTFIIGFVAGVWFIRTISQLTFTVYMHAACHKDLLQSGCIIHGSTQMCGNIMVALIPLCGGIPIIFMFMRRNGAKLVMNWLCVLLLVEIGLGVLISIKQSQINSDKRAHDIMTRAVTSCDERMLSRACIQHVSKGSCANITRVNELLCSRQGHKPIDINANPDIISLLESDFQEKIKVQQHQTVELTDGFISQFFRKCHDKLMSDLFSFQQAYINIPSALLFGGATLHLVCVLGLWGATHIQEVEKRKLTRSF